MPKATTIRKSKFINDDSDNTIGSTSVDLFDVHHSVPVDDNNDRDARNKQGGGQKKTGAERNGSQDLQINVDGDLKDSEKDRRRNKVGGSGCAKDAESASEQDNAVTRKGKRDNGTSQAAEERGRVVREGKKTDSGTRESVKRGKEKTRNTGNEFAEGKGNGKDERHEIKLRDFPLKDFDVTKILLAPKFIQHGPFPTSREHEVYIIMDGVRYKVSKCSVRDGKYIQGLDSRFLISKYRPWEKEN